MGLEVESFACSVGGDEYAGRMFRPVRVERRLDDLALG
jgi:hypothetical protein